MSMSIHFQSKRRRARDKPRIWCNHIIPFGYATLENTEVITKNTLITSSMILDYDTVTVSGTTSHYLNYYINLDTNEKIKPVVTARILTSTHPPFTVGQLCSLVFSSKEKLCNHLKCA